MKRTLLLALALAALGAAACGDDESDGSVSAAKAQKRTGEARLAAQRKKAPPGVTVKAAASQYGKVLFSKGGRAIYYFDRESSSKPQCYGACAKAWPPVLTKGKPQAAGSVKQGLLSTKKRSNGKRQVLYDGHPLYYYVDDPKGEVLCHNVEEFGGLWLAVKPSGAPVP